VTKAHTVSADFTNMQIKDKHQKDDHLRLFRPNLENPANKNATKELD
jgi:hypothetical protein